VFAEKLKKKIQPTKFVQNHTSLGSETRLSQKLCLKKNLDALVRTV